MPITNRVRRFDNTTYVGTSTGESSNIWVDSADTLKYVDSNDAVVSVATLPGVSAAKGKGFPIVKQIAFTEDATSTSHTGSVVLPAGAVLLDVQVTNSALWTGGTATLKVGDTADDDGYFTGVNLKATDLLVGEVLSAADSNKWGGKNGAYLVQATGRMGPTSSNFGNYYAAGSTITGVVTVGTPATTAGRTFMTVVYTVPVVTAATAA